MKLKETEQTKHYTKIINNERNHIKGTSRSSRTTDMELFVKIVNHCNLTDSKSTHCGNYSMVHILIVINYYLNKPEKIFQGYRKSTEYSVLFQTHSNYEPNLWQSGIYQR